MFSLLSLISTIIIGCVSPDVSYENLITYDRESIIIANEDKCLGSVNLCDPNGNTCMSGTAYQDKENGRIYVLIASQGSTKYYSQRSNDEKWPYMLRFGNKWYYFSF